MKNLPAYADLIVRIGTNLQSGQTLLINALLDHAPLVRELTEAGYRAAARSSSTRRKRI
jgi:aminopeptidase